MLTFEYLNPSIRHLQSLFLVAILASPSLTLAGSQTFNSSGTFTIDSRVSSPMCVSGGRPDNRFDYRSEEFVERFGVNQNAGHYCFAGARASHHHHRFMATPHFNRTGMVPHRTPWSSCCAGNTRQYLRQSSRSSPGLFVRRCRWATTLPNCFSLLAHLRKCKQRRSWEGSANLRLAGLTGLRLGAIVSVLLPTTSTRNDSNLISGLFTATRAVSLPKFESLSASLPSCGLILSPAC